MATKSEEIAWAAGLFEGEGSVCFGNNTVTLSVAMTDEDVVRKFHKLIGYGYVNGPYKRNNGKWKDQWQWRSQGSQYSQITTAILWPYLGLRRRQQLKDAIGKWKLVKPINKVNCDKCGLPLEVLDKNGVRGCKPCRRVRRRAAYRKKNPLVRRIINGHKKIT